MPMWNDHHPDDRTSYYLHMRRVYHWPALRAWRAACEWVRPKPWRHHA